MDKAETDNLIRENAKHIAVINDEMGGLEKKQAEIKTDVEWLKKIVEKIDNRTWYILTAIILGFIIQIVLRFVL